MTYKKLMKIFYPTDVKILHVYDEKYHRLVVNRFGDVVNSYTLKQLKRAKVVGIGAYDDALIVHVKVR